MRQLKMKMLEMNLTANEAKNQIDPLLKSNVACLNREEFGLLERGNMSSAKIGLAKKELQNNQTKILEVLEEIHPDKSIVLNFEMHVTIN